MTLAQLTYFMEIVRTKNFTVAASNLFVSQSSLSYAIHELEAELDVPLFVRRPNKKIELTIYGEAFYPMVAEGIRLIEEGKNHIVSMHSPLHGKLRLGFFHSIVFSAVPALLAAFKEDNPGNEIENLYSQPMNAVWAVFFPPYCVAFPCNPSGLLRKISLSDEKNPRPSGIPRL